MSSPDSADSSRVDVLFDAALLMSDAEVRKLLQLFERKFNSKPDPVDAIVTAIAGLSVTEMGALRQRLTALFKVEPVLPPPAGEPGGPGGEASVGAFPKRTPPELSGGAAKELG